MDPLYVWTIEDIGPKVGLLDPTNPSDADVQAVNDSGIVVGYAKVRTTGPLPEAGHAFLIDGTTVFDIHPTQATWSTAEDINGAGWIAGFITLPGNWIRLGMVRDPAGTMTILNHTPGWNSPAYGISDAGHVVGAQRPEALPEAYEATLWGPPLPSAATTPLSLHAAPFAETIAQWVNDAGQVAGGIAREPGAWKPAFYAGGVWTEIVPVPGLPHPMIADMNASGTIVGWSPATRTTPDSAFVFEAGQLSLIPSPSPWFQVLRAHGISNAGHVVGIANSLPFEGYVPFISHKVGGVRRLDSLLPPNTGWKLMQVDAISPNGSFIVGTGWIDGRHRLFRMRGRYVPGPRFQLPNLVHILYGGIDDSGGIDLPHGGGRPPIPIPPWDPRFAATPGMTEVLQALELHERAGRLGDAELRSRLQPLLLENARRRLEQMHEASRVTSGVREIERTSLPSRIVGGE